MEIFGKQYQIHSFFLSVWREIENLFFRSGNVGQVGDECTIFDAASFYGHHEYDLGIAGMFGGFSNEFYKNYHEEIPKESGFEERHLLYKLFHNLNHW